MSIDPARLVDLHKAVTNFLIDSIVDNDHVEPKLVEAAIKFLKDNNINADLSGSSEKRKENLRLLLSDLPKFAEEEGDVREAV